jgi:starch synthase (maltosyl-transferring)
MEHVARPGSGEYIDNEKFELRQWDLHRGDSLRGLIKRINRIRRDHKALQHTRNVRFHGVDNDRLICFSKRDDHEALVVVVNLDYHHRQSGWVDLDLQALGLDPHESFQVHDLLGDGRYLWSGARNYVELDPGSSPAQIFRIRHRLRSERDFDYFV